MDPCTLRTSDENGKKYRTFCTLSAVFNRNESQNEMKNNFPIQSNAQMSTCSQQSNAQMAVHTFVNILSSEFVIFGSTRMPKSY